MNPKRELVAEGLQVVAFVAEAPLVRIAAAVPDCPEALPVARLPFTFPRPNTALLTRNNGENVLYAMILIVPWNAM